MRLHAAALIAAAVALSGCATEMLTGFSNDRDWQVVESPHFIFHYRTGSDAARNISQLVAAAEKDYVAVTTLLDIQFNAVINYYIYRRDEGNSFAPDSHADYPVLAIHQSYDVLVYHSGDSLGRHEMTHVIANQALDPAKLKFLSEGLAVASDGTYGRAPIDDCQFWQNDSLWTVRAMLDRPNDYDEWIFYPRAGSFVRYLMTRYGVASFKQLYPVSYEAFDSEFARLYGHTLEDVESEYREYLADFCGQR